MKNRTYCMSGIDGIDIYAIPGFGNRVLIGPFNKAHEMVGFEDPEDFEVAVVEEFETIEELIAD